MGSEVAGGGWYGGYSCNVSAASAAGGGSGHIGNMNSGNTTSSSHTGHGSVTITYEDVNLEEDSISGIILEDISKPNTPSNASSTALTTNTLTVNWQDNGDNGTINYHKVESYNKDNGELLNTSNVTSSKYTSEIKGYYYKIDSAQGTVVNNTNGTFVDTNSVQTTKPTSKTYIHIAAVDNAGNVSETLTYEIPSISKYKVTHNIMNLDGSTYSLRETEDLVGITGETATPEVKTYTGFTSPQAKTVIVSSDGNTVVNYYYERNKYQVTLECDDGLNSITGEGLYYYEQEVTINADVNQDYIWLKWTGNNDILTESSTFIMGAEDLYYKANTIKKSKVTVKYVDINTNENMQDDIIIDGYLGKDYTTEKKEFENYTFLHSKGNTSGKMVDRGSTVIYYYAKNTSILVRYIDKYTNEELEPSERIEGYVGKKYLVNPLSILKYNVAEDTGNTSGKMTDDEIVIEFYYEKYSGVLVKYVDLNTNREISEAKLYPGFSTNEYDVSEDNIKIKGYTYMSNSGNTIGTMKNDYEEVIFYYVYNSKVVANYIDITNGKLIYNEEIEGYEGKEYETRKMDIEGYTLNNYTDNVSGIMTRDTIEVNYYYLKDTKLIVKYIDYTINEKIVDQQEFDMAEGQKYDVSDLKKSLEGYEYLKSTGNEVGCISREGTKVIFYYVKKVNITVRFIDIHSKKELKPSLTYSTKAGENYDLKMRPQIDGYKLVETTDNMVGKAKNDEIETIYYYAKKSRVIIKYQDKDTGEEIAKEDIINGYEGLDYKTERLNSKGYNYIGTSENTEGTMTDKDTIVYYYYSKKTNESSENIDTTVATGIIPNTGENDFTLIAIKIIMSSIISFLIVEVGTGKYTEKK